MLVRADLFAALDGFDVACDPGRGRARLLLARPPRRGARDRRARRARAPPRRRRRARRRPGAPPPGARAAHVDVDGAPALDRAGRTRGAVRGGLRLLPASAARRRARADRRLDAQPRSLRRGPRRAAAGAGGARGERRRDPRAAVPGERARVGVRRDHAARAGPGPGAVGPRPDRRRHRRGPAAQRPGPRAPGDAGAGRRSACATSCSGAWPRSARCCRGPASAISSAATRPSGATPRSARTRRHRRCSCSPALLRIVTLGAGGFARTLVVVGAIPLGMFGAFRLARSVAGRGWPPVVVAVVYGAVPAPAERDRARAPRRARAVRARAVHRASRSSCSPTSSSTDGPAGASPRSVVSRSPIAAAWWPLAILLPVVRRRRPRDRRAGERRRSRDAAPRRRRPRSRSPASGSRCCCRGRSRSRSPATGPRPSGSCSRRSTRSARCSGSRPARAVPASAAGRSWWSRCWCCSSPGATPPAGRPGGGGSRSSPGCSRRCPAWLGSASPDPEGRARPGRARGGDPRRASGPRASSARSGASASAGARPARCWRACSWSSSVFGFVGDLVGGRFHQPAADWPDTLSWMNLQGDRGPFRVLWVGDAATVPGYRQAAGPDGYALIERRARAISATRLPPPGRRRRGRGQRRGARAPDAARRNGSAARSRRWRCATWC